MTRSDAKTNIGILWFAIICFFIYDGIYAYKVYDILNNWNKSEATILSSKVLQKDSSNTKDHDTYKAEIKYSYVTDNLRYKNDKLNPQLLTWTTGRSKVRKVVNFYKVGDKYLVYISPKRPIRIIS